MTSPEPLLTVDEVGERLGLSRRTVYRLLASGDLSHVSRPTGFGLKRRTYVTASALDRFIEARTAEQVSP